MARSSLVSRSRESFASAELIPDDEPFLVARVTSHPLSSFLRDLPTLSRWVGHLTLALIVLLVTYNLVPRGLNFPELAPLSSPQGDWEESTVTEGSVDSDNSHYLQFAGVPITVRAMRDILPISVPERTMRTSVMVYRVQPGDTLLGIAEKFGIKGTSLIYANEKLGDNPDFLRLDQELNILPVDGAYHTVAKGETLEKIAATYKVDPSAIYGFGGNNLEVPYTLTQGQQLIIPGGVKPYVPRRVVSYSGPVPANAQKGSGAFAWPMSGYITQRYWEGHQAIDIGGPTGTSIVASDSGYVAVAQWSDVGYGRMVIIDHGNGFQTLYAHLDVFYVEVGQSVVKGQKIALAGTTGNVTGPHLHFEVINNGVRRNPFIYLP